MKYFLTLTLSFFALVLLAQSGTTLDEYRYLSKGYAYQLEMGLDPTKNGYVIHNNYTAKNGTSILGLYRTKSKIPQGLLFVVSDESGKTYYRALPNPQSADNVLALYQQDQNQHLPIDVRKKMEEAKDHYLFKTSSFSQPTDLANSNIAPTTKYSEKITSPSPVTYESIPTKLGDDRFTAKGVPQTAIDHNEKTTLPATAPAKTTPANLGGTTIAGQLNEELNSRTILFEPNAQNTTKAKGRVVIKFCADAKGVVTYAKFTQRGSTTLNSQLKALALAAVREMRLATSAKNDDCGTVRFDF